MIEAAFLHAPEDAEAARALAAHWPEHRAICVETNAQSPPPLFGQQILVCALWTGAAADALSLAAALASAKRRGVLITAPGATVPEVLESAGAPIVELTGDAAADAQTLAAVARDVAAGRFLTAGPTKPRQTRRAPRSAPVPPPTALAKPSTPTPPLQARSRNRAIGFAVGAAFGAALFFFIAAPRISALIDREEPPPPPSLLRQAAATTRAAPPPVTAPVAPPAAAAPPLRGLSDTHEDAAPTLESAPPA